jgi:hypothetical protein
VALAIRKRAIESAQLSHAHFVIILIIFIIFNLYFFSLSSIVFIATVQRRPDGDSSAQ